MSRARIAAAFPRIKGALFITSPPTPGYNCIAWAVAADTERWWWPQPRWHYYWPEGAPFEETVNDFIRTFQTLGFETCAGEELEKGLEKIAIYVGADGKPTHAARQLANGSWTSKLGAWEDVRHSLRGLTGDRYGEVAHFMRRPRL